MYFIVSDLDAHFSAVNSGSFNSFIMSYICVVGIGPFPFFRDNRWTINFVVSDLDALFQW